MKEDTAFELSTGLFTLEQLKETDLDTYDSFYLGNPFCSSYRGNLSLTEKDLREASLILKDRGKHFYLTTHAAPRGRDLEEVKRICNRAMERGAKAVEFHNMGVLYLASREFPEIPLHGGSFANIYSLVTANLLEEYGVKRILPNVEVSLDEMEMIREGSELEVSLSLHGKMPLGIVPDCFFLEGAGKEESCPEACLTPAWLKTKLWEIKHVGKGLYSGLDLCLIEHLGDIVARGFRHFRIESGYEESSYRNEIGRIYREGIQFALEKNFKFQEKWGAILGNHSKKGFCNGYLFGKSGRVYCGQSGEEIPSPLW